MRFKLSAIAPIVRTLFDVGDKLLISSDRSLGLLSIENDIRISRILYGLLRRLNENDRFELLKQAISDGRSISTIVHEVAVLGQQQGKYGSTAPIAPTEVTVSKEHLGELELSALQKIRDFAIQGRLLEAPNFLGPVYRWLDWGGEPEVKNWVQKVTETQEGLARYLARIVVPKFSTPFSESSETAKYDLERRAFQAE
jgi:predicted KAP-like P-loop ATPase